MCVKRKASELPYIYSILRNMKIAVVSSTVLEAKTSGLIPGKIVISE